MTTQGDDKNTRKRLAWIAVVALLAIVIGGLLIGFVASGETNEYTLTQGTHLNATEGPEVALEEDVNTTSQHHYPDNNTLKLSPHGTFSSPGASEVHIQGIESEWTNLTALAVSNNALTVDLDGKQTVTVSGDADTFEYRNMSVDDGDVDFRYSGPDGGTTSATIQGMPTGTTIVAWDPTTGDRLDWGHVGSDGELVLSSLPQSEHDVELRTANEPVFDDSSATPTGPQSTVPDEFAVDVSHGDFPNTTVDVSFRLNGDVIGNDTLESNGTANISGEYSADAGTNTWSAVATDDYGNEVTSSEYEFTVPDTLYIYNESKPSALVDNETVDLEFYFDNGETANRTTSNGEVDMSGLPAGEPFVVVAQANGFHPRRIYLSGLDQEGEMYLLPTSKEYVDLTFDLEDFTGDYRSENTVMKIQRSLNGEYKTIEGDYFGATGQFTSQLRYNTRHRLILLNTETGQERNLGTITPTNSGLQTVQVTGSDTILLGDTGPSISIGPQVRALPATQGASVTAEIGGDAEIEEWTLTATHIHDGTSETLLQQTYSGDKTSASPSFNLTDRSGTVRIEVEVTTADGTTMTRTAVYTIREHYQTDNSLFDALKDAVNLLPGDGEGTPKLLAAIFTVIITASAARTMALSPEGAGVVALLCVAGFAVIGWLAMDVVFAGAVTGVTMLAIRRGI